MVSNIFRRLEAQDHLRRRQAEVAAEKRAELAAQKAALLQARIDRGVRVRRARQLRSERLAAQKADEREAAAEAARRYICSRRALTMSKPVVVLCGMMVTGLKNGGGL